MTKIKLWAGDSSSLKFDGAMFVRYSLIWWFDDEGGRQCQYSLKSLKGDYKGHSTTVLHTVLKPFDVNEGFLELFQNNSVLI